MHALMPFLYSYGSGLSLCISDFGTTLSSLHGVLLVARVRIGGSFSIEAQNVVFAR